MHFFRYQKLMPCFAPEGEGSGAGGGQGDPGAGEGGAAAGGSGIGTELELPKSAEELTKLIQSETEKALKVSQGNWQKEFQTKLEKETAEAARLAKLSADEREKELEKKKKEELDQRETTIKSQELTLKATDMLTAEGLPLEIRSLVIGKDEADTKARIDSFKGVFQKAVEAAVNAKLAGSARPGASGGSDDKSYDEMSVDEINAMLYGKK